jgi:hypothetical protein
MKRRDSLILWNEKLKKSSEKEGEIILAFY